MRYIDWLLPAGLGFLVAGIMLLWKSATGGPAWLLWLALAALLAAGAAFGAAAWRARRRVDWRRVEMEQRMWESGPVGRLWLKYRKIYAKR
ncbi:MAG: hypothetical protein FIB01_12785 [Gemmatimonadetes bacterium]|nr:hypothetical protein [Gemmatimonadota bacterium]